ncbi:hypothetical protein QO021_29290 (plasmid) [Pseudomonas amygdali pv. lachrymans]|jgi:membrane protein implicated in regulation of membrane protease activity|uniref:Uncharacterized protein n=1 Tax=Pseudomonas syringae pv. maculicola str. ES4326 TaxID=629265 RepID=A0A8T8CBD8_PSEYM|nr:MULTISPECIES: hypothetical protein [Pseudomonas syringae group]QHF00617.1 hypothetical protein PMA4326_029390 [Pseudomonas syringae pv. maculicola str. ES4326]RMM39312.1 hypothetical protein ALQ79_200030 [Pseudomonas amygdali pv. lachrymans]UBZ00609.1 hypothetical protein LCG56_28015 [Pseudomonas cannabina pv. alisalensis]WIO61655.1 hypothetical protein QO021_29290 [Pseudomonas amygdali pv. lachrymans]
MSYIKNLMLAIVSAIMGTVSASLFEGWTVKEQKIAFLISVLMVAVMLTKSSTSSRGKSRKKKLQQRGARKRKSLRGKKRKGHGP